MSEIERMNRYIDKTNIPNALRYNIRLNECTELVHLSQETPMAIWDVIYQAFKYGMAKGYRAAKKEGVSK